MSTRRPAALTIALLIAFVASLGPITAARCCNLGMAVSACVCKHPTAPPGTRISRNCCRAIASQHVSPATAGELLASTTWITSPAAHAVTVPVPVAPSIAITSVAPRSRGPTSPLWLTQRALRC